MPDSLTHSQTTEYSATQLVYSIKFKLSHAILTTCHSSIQPFVTKPIANLMKWRWPSSSYSCWLLLIIWLALTFMTYFFLEPVKVLVGSKIVTSIFCQSSMSPDHSGVGVQFIHISHNNSKSNPNFPKTPPKPPLLNQFIKKFHLRKLSLIISSITASIICDLLKQLLQWSQLTLTQLVRRLCCSKRWKIWKPFPAIQGLELDQEMLSKERLLCIYVKICHHMYLISRQWLSKGTHKQ